MAKTRPLITRMSKGELSPLLEGSSDLAAYFEGASVLENFHILRQGGVRRWPGSRYIQEVKDSSKDTILLPFEFSVDEAYILEVGDLYLRIYKNKAPVMNGGSPVEVVTPFDVAAIREIHFTQSNDILFLFHNDFQQRKLSRVSDVSWSLSLQPANPPPSFEADTNFGDTLAPEANSGTDVQFRAGSAIFLAADAGRQIIAGAGRAIITSVTDTTEVVADILDPFSQSITAGANTLTSVGTAVASTAHGTVAGEFMQLTNGAQVGQIREIASVTDADNVVLVTAFTVNQVGTTWNHIVPIAAADWGLRLSPQTTLDPTLKGPTGSLVTVAAGVAAFRAADVGKFIVVYGGVIKLTVFTSTTSMKGTILSPLTEATNANPAAADAGTWTLEEASWSLTRGYPRTGEFYQGRLYTASTDSEPVTFWGSRSDDYDNNALGVTAEDAVEYTMAARQLNRIEWLAEHNKTLLIGTSGAEFKASGSGADNAVIGGDTIPIIERLATNGCAPIQPRQARRSTLYIDRSRRKVMMIGFDLESDGETATEISVGAEHITESGVRLGPLSFAHRLDPRLYFDREDGQQVAMTFFPEQKVVAFSRRVTDGTIESRAVIPSSAGLADQVWIIAKRTINGVEKRFVELYEEHHEGLTTRGWTSLQTDCAIVLTGLTGTSIPVAHLEAKTVDVVKNASFIGSYLVTGGVITLLEAVVAADVLEVGLHYDSTATTLRPAIPGTNIHGLPRSWDSLFVRLHESKGGTINGEAIQYEASDLDENELFTGDKKVTGQGWSTDGRTSLVQNQPYPMTMLALFGTLSLGDRD